MKGQSFVVKGHPVPQPRPRVTTLKLGDVTRGQAYVPKNHRVHAWRATCAAEFKAHGHKYEGPLDVTLVFHFPRPKSHYGTGRNAEQVKDSAPELPIRAKDGDLDNSCKAVLDAGNGLLWDDDAQVCSLHALKRYAPIKGAEGVIVTVRELSRASPGTPPPSD